MYIRLKFKNRSVSINVHVLSIQYLKKYHMVSKHFAQLFWLSKLERFVEMHIYTHQLLLCPNQ